MHISLHFLKSVRKYAIAALITAVLTYAINWLPAGRVPRGRYTGEICGLEITYIFTRNALKISADFTDDFAQLFPELFTVDMLKDTTDSLSTQGIFEMNGNNVQADGCTEAVYDSVFNTVRISNPFEITLRHKPFG